MAVDYYLLNGQKRNSNALNLLVNGKLVRDFPDISTIDLQTLNIPVEESKDVLSEYNPDTNLNGIFYNASYPHKDNTVKTYAAIFDYGDKTRYYSDKLRYFAEQRDFKKSHRQKLELDQNKELYDYIRRIMRDVLTSNNDNLIAYNSLISKKLKSIIDEKHYEYRNTNTERFLDFRMGVLKSLLKGYTELRNLTFEYMSTLTNTNSCTRKELEFAKYWSNNRMTKTMPKVYTKKEDIVIEPEYTQMTLFDFSDINPKVKVKK